ncbi:MAG: glycosyltransferase family 4 protein [Methanobacteriota archaeon]
MKVLLVATDFPVKRGGSSVTYGGAGACMAQLVSGLVEKGVEVTVITRREKGSYAELFDVPVYRTAAFDFGVRQAKIAHSVTVLPKLLSVCQREEFDVIHSHNPAAGFPAVFASKKSGVHHVTTMHGPWADVRIGRATRSLLSAMEGWTLKNADFVTCDSKQLAEFVVGKYNLDPEKVSAIENAVETDRFNPKLCSKKKAREKIGVKTDDKLVLYTGRFLVEKGIDYLVGAVPDVLDKLDDVSFLFLGGGFDEHVVSDWIDNEKLSRKVFNVPYVPYELMPYAYLASDVLVQPSLAEGLSRSILEAMACGLPIIASDVGGNPELVSPENGLLVEPKSSKAISDAIIQVFSSPSKLRLMGGKSREKVEASFTVEKRIQSFIDLYERVA